MEQEMQKMLGALLEWAQQGGAFVKEQAPLYVQELLAWRFWSAAMTAGLCAAVFIVAFKVNRWVTRRYSEETEAHGFMAGEPFFAGAVVTVIACIGSLVMGIGATYSAVKVKVAPRVVVVEALREAVK